jgi:hypothetical protein
VDRNKIEKLEKLVSRRLTPYFVTVRKNEGGKCVRLELTFSFNKEEEIDEAIKRMTADTSV